MTDHIDCPEGQEQGPAIDDVAAYCVPADVANPGEEEVVEITLPVQPPDWVEPFPPALPLDPLPQAPEIGTPIAVVPVPRELAETGSADPLTTFIYGTIVIAVGIVLWANRSK